FKTPTPYFKAPTSANDQPSANLTSGDLKQSSQVAQANSLLNNTYQALVAISSSSIGGNSASDLPFSSFATSYTDYIQGLQKALGVGGSIQNTAQTLLNAYQEANTKGAQATGLGASLYGIDQFLGSDLISDKQDGGYSLNSRDLSTLQVLSNVNQDFNGKLVIKTGDHYSLANIAGVKAALSANPNEYMVGALTTNLNTIANNILNTSTASQQVNGSVPSNVASLNAVLKALSQMSSVSDTAKLEGLINPNHYTQVYNAYESVINDLTTLQQDLHATSLGAAFNALLDLGYSDNGSVFSGQLMDLPKELNNTLTQTQLQELYEALQPSGQTTLLKTITSLDADISESNSLFSSSNTSLSTGAGGTPSSSTTRYPDGKFSSWITTTLINQGIKDTAFGFSSNTAPLATFTSQILNYTSNANALSALLSKKVSLQDILSTAISEMGTDLWFSNQTQPSGQQEAKINAYTNQQALVLNNLRAIQYAEKLLGGYLDTIGVGSTPPKSLDATDKLALYEFNQALIAPKNGLIAQTQTAIQQYLSPSNYNKGQFNTSTLSAEAAKIIQAATAMHALQIFPQNSGGTLDTQQPLYGFNGPGSIISMLKPQVSPVQYLGFAAAAVNTLALDFSPAILDITNNNGPDQIQQGGGEMANILNNFGALSTKNLTTMETELSNFDSAVQALDKSNTNFNGGNLISNTSSLDTNGIKSQNAQSYLQALIDAYQPQTEQNMVLAKDAKDLKQTQQPQLTPTQQATSDLHTLMQNLNSSNQTASGAIELIEGLNTYTHNNELLTILTGSENTAQIDADVLAYAQTFPLFKSLTGQSVLEGLFHYNGGNSGTQANAYNISQNMVQYLSEFSSLLNRYNYLEGLAKKAAQALKTNAPAKDTIPTPNINASPTPGATNPTSKGGQQGQQGQQGQGTQGTDNNGGQTTGNNNNPQGNSQGQQGQNPNNHQGTQSASNSLQNLINSIVDNELQNIQQLQSAMNHYFNQVEQTIKSTTSAIISSLDNVSAAQAVQNIVAGLENYASNPENNLVNNPTIPQGFKTEVAHFIQNMQAQDIDLELMQLNLDSLINQASQMRVELLDNLANAINPQNLSSLASFVALPAKLDLSPDQAQNTKQAIQGLNNLLIYLNAAKNKMAAYAKESPEVFLNRAGNIGLPNQTTNSNANMYGIDVQVGYKQFFGKKRRWGLRYYGSFSYQRGVFYNRNISSLNDFVYGAGVDALYNFYESKDSKYTTGVFLGFMLAGSSWVDPHYNTLHTEMGYINAAGGKAQMHTSYFQIPLNLGFRTNVTKHHGFEIGLRIPLAVNYYFRGSLDGAHLETTYKRNVAVYVNYVYNF
ncbi:outer membrane protein, partial [Helicobacter heilmannii]|uniref:outer membrane protein n=1 Tax=Helicobacter heilmannii TaxID=35817 RepID=UPI001F41FAFC